MKATPIERKEMSSYIERHDFSPFLDSKTVLITGSKGLLGSALIKWILLQNEIRGTQTRIIASTRTPDQIPEYIETGDNILYWSYGKEDRIDERIDYIIHTASPMGNKNHIQYPVETFTTNVDGTRMALKVAEKNPGCKMIYLSSEEVYGLPVDNSPAMKEDMVGAIDSLNLRSCYPLGKKSAEFLCYASAEEYGIDVRIIRMTVIQGLFQKYDEARVANELVRCIVENKDFTMKTDGLTKKCMLYTLDALTGIFTVLFKGEKGQAYNASNPDTFLTVRDLACHVVGKFNPEIKVVFGEPAKKEEGFLPHRTLVQDCSKLMSLGWKPESDLDHIYEVDIERFTQEGHP